MGSSREGTRTWASMGSQWMLAGLHLSTPTQGGRQHHSDWSIAMHDFVSQCSVSSGLQSQTAARVLSAGDGPYPPQVQATATAARAGRHALAAGATPQPGCTGHGGWACAGHCWGQSWALHAQPQCRGLQGELGEDAALSPPWQGLSALLRREPQLLASCAGLVAPLADCGEESTSRKLELRRFSDDGLLPSVLVSMGCHLRSLALQGHPHQQGQQGLEMGSTTGNGLPPGGQLRRRLTHDAADLQSRRTPWAPAYKRGSLDDSYISRGGPESSASSQAALLHGQVAPLWCHHLSWLSQQRVKSWSLVPVDWVFVS